MIKRINPALKQVGTPSLAASRGWTLHEPAASGDLTTCIRLMEQGAVIDAKDDNGWTALRFAVQYRHINLIALLLKKGADPNIKFGNNKTCAHQAAYSGDMAVLEMLYNAGADIHATDDFGFSVRDMNHMEKEEENEMERFLRERKAKRKKMAHLALERRKAFELPPDLL